MRVISKGVCRSEVSANGLYAGHFAMQMMALRVWASVAR
jgi:hypothetical protein